MAIAKHYKNMTITAESWETSNAWGHKATLYIDGESFATNRIRYYNRTWESYQYQTVMRSLLYEVLEDMEKHAIYNYKLNNSVSRLSAAKKDAIIADLKTNNQEYIDIREFYNSL